MQFPGEKQSCVEWSEDLGSIGDFWVGAELPWELGAFALILSR